MSCTHHDSKLAKCQRVLETVPTHALAAPLVYGLVTHRCMPALLTLGSEKRAAPRQIRLEHAAPQCEMKGLGWSSKKRSRDASCTFN